jgi:hypothetical protein
VLGRVAGNSGTESHEVQSMMILLGAAAVAMLGVLFFFAIIGVFGMAIAVLALLAFVASAIFIVCHPPRRELDP